MSQLQNNSTKVLNHARKLHLATPSKPGRRREENYKNVCIACRIPNTKKLVTIRRASGDLYLCRKHARAWLGEL